MLLNWISALLFPNSRWSSRLALLRSHSTAISSRLVRRFSCQFSLHRKLSLVSFVWCNFGRNIHSAKISSEICTTTFGHCLTSHEKNEIEKTHKLVVCVCMYFFLQFLRAHHIYHYSGWGFSEGVSNEMSDAKAGHCRWDFVVHLVGSTSVCVFGFLFMHFSWPTSSIRLFSVYNFCLMSSQFRFMLAHTYILHLVKQSHPTKHYTYTTYNRLWS